MTEIPTKGPLCDPMEAAAEGGNIPAMAFLLGAGADPDGHERERWPLFRASQHGHEECARWLVEMGATNFHPAWLEHHAHLARIEKWNLFPAECLPA